MADTAVLIARCLPLYVLLAEKKLRFHSSPAVTGRYIAGIVILHSAGAAGKSANQNSPGFKNPRGVFLVRPDYYIT
jgi:hypothetical protein